MTEPIESAEPAPPIVPWRAIEGLPVWILSLIGTVLLGIPLALLFDRDQATALLIVGNEILLGVVVIAWIRLRYRAGVESLALKGTVADAAVGVGVGLLGVVVASITASILIAIVDALSKGPVQEPNQIPLDRAPSTPLLVVIGFGVIVAAPLAEEMFFRGFLFRALKRGGSTRRAIFLSALFFAVAHVSPLLIPPIFVLGLMLAAVVDRRGSIVCSVAAHMTFNAWGFLLFVLNR